ncbi:MAG: hypothetical protein NVSMB1_02730 [Polyangiales bacterium]
MTGFLTPAFALQYRPLAIPRDQFIYGANGIFAGMIVRGEPITHWNYLVQFGFSPNGLAYVGDVGTLDLAGDGRSFGISVSKGKTTEIPVDEATIAYKPIDGLTAKIGWMHIPFSIAQIAVITASMFPSRPGPTSIFQFGADQGALIRYDTKDDRLHASVGLFNGISLGLQIPTTTTTGAVFSGFLDLQPFGKLPDVEGDSTRGGFRLGLGMAALYRDGKLYDATGFEAIRFRDLRLDAALRVAFRGLYLQTEYLRRQQTDSLSGRPLTATGFYAQGSYFVPLAKSIAVAPITRYGFATIDESFAPRKTIFFESGVAFFPRADLPEPGALRIIAEYVSERRVTEQETSYGGLLQLHLKW